MSASGTRPAASMPATTRRCSAACRRSASGPAGAQVAVTEANDAARPGGNRLLGNLSQCGPERPVFRADEQFPPKVNAVPANLRIPGRYYLAIFVLACATLSFQILITRFFSVMLYYH